MSTSQQTKIPFGSDGCSGGFSIAWEKVTGNKPPFEQCCFIHDEAYYVGGGLNPTLWDNIKLRWKADLAFAKCLWKHSTLGKVFSFPMWLAVRIGGGAYWPTPYRWGFGFNDSSAD